MEAQPTDPRNGGQSYAENHNETLRTTWFGHAKHAHKRILLALQCLHADLSGIDANPIVALGNVLFGREYLDGEVAGSVLGVGERSLPLRQQFELLSQEAISLSS